MKVAKKYLCVVVLLFCYLVMNQPAASIIAVAIYAYTNPLGRVGE